MQTHAQVIEQVVGKSVGDIVDLKDGVYVLNVFEYHVKDFKLEAKFNAHTSSEQLNFDSVLFPEKVPTL